MQTFKSFFAFQDEGSLIEKTLKETKQNIYSNIIKTRGYVDSVGKIKSYKKLLLFLLNLYASENILEDIHQFKETPIELMEFFIPQIVGYYITHSDIYPY